MLSGATLGALVAVGSALVWGSGDFAGGLATRRDSQFRVLALSAMSGLLALIVLAIIRGEGAPDGPSALWAVAAGVAGAVGIAALYDGLSHGQAAIVAPSSAVISAALPVLVSAFIEGVPGPLTLAGIALALPGIWLVAQEAPGHERPSRDAMLLGAAAGVGFAGFFIFIAQVSADAVFAPLVIARAGTLAVALLMLAQRGQRLPRPGGNPLALLAGTLDAGGNVLFLVASQLANLAIAAVLSSMYAATTVLLARLILKDRVRRRQWAGVALCSVAVALIVA